MKTQGIIFITFILFVSVFMGVHNWIVVLPIALGVLNGYVNKVMADKFKVGDVYHTAQFFVLFIIMNNLVWLGWVKYDEVLLMTMLYWIPFEISYNLFDGQSYDYIGESGKIDRFIRGKFKTYGLAKLFLIVLKLVLFVAGVTIFMLNKPI